MTEEEKKAAEQEAENLAKEAEAKALAEAEAKKKSEADVDYYKTQLTNLQQSLDKKEELEKKQKEIIDHKNNAIEALKRENKEGLENLKTSLRDEILGELKTSLVGEVKDIVNNDKIDKEIAKYAAGDENATKLIRLHYDKVLKNSEVHTTLAEKIEAAAILANKDLILKRGIKEGMEAKREDVMSAFSAPGTATSGKGGVDESDPVFRALKAHLPDSLKNPKVVAAIRK